MHPSCQTLGAAIGCKQSSVARVEVSLARKPRSPARRPSPSLAPESPGLYRTATAVGHATAAKFFSQGVSLVVAARPSAGRSRARVRTAICRSPSRCRMGFYSGTLPLVNTAAALHSCHKRPFQSCLLGSRASGGKSKQSKTQVPQSRSSAVWLGRERKGGSSHTAPNPSVNRTANGLRPSSAGYLGQH